MAAYLYNLGLLFADVAARYPSRPALRYPDSRAYSYAAIHKLSNQLAGYLDSHGMRKGQVAAIFNDKSAWGFCLMLACLKRGIIYANLDFTSPPERLRRILDTCQPAMLFHGGHCAELVEEVNAYLPEIPVIAYQEAAFQQAVESFAADNPAGMEAIHGGDAAYLMFTSGSTGFPKGAAMSHSNLLHFIRWGQATFGISPDDVCSNVNPIYFDNSVFDFYTALFSGACLLPLGHEEIKDPRKVARIIDEQACTIWFSVPSFLVYLLVTKALGPENFAAVRTIIFGGEGFPKTKLRQLHELYGHRAQLVNVYGPTECTCICSAYPITAKDFAQMQELAPLGAIAPNFGYEILPQEEGPGFGELALTGPCVGLGYYNDPERTAASFVRNPAKAYQETMYKTGDLVQRDSSGLLHFKGRVDNQIKHMGYRIELEEIEAALNSLPYVNESGAVYQKISPELGQIVGFAGINTPGIEPSLVLEDARKILPPYMVPKKLHILAQLPKNKNGKVDRGQLKQLLSSA